MRSIFSSVGMYWCSHHIHCDENFTKYQALLSSVCKVNIFCWAFYYCLKEKKKETSRLYSYKAYSKRKYFIFQGQPLLLQTVTFQQWVTMLTISLCLLSYGMWLEQLAPCMLFCNSLSNLHINIPNARNSFFLYKPVLQYLFNKIYAQAVISDYVTLSL